MERLARALVMIGLATTVPVAAQQGVLRHAGTSAPLATPSQAASDSVAPYAGLRSVTAQMKEPPRKLAHAAAPMHPLPHAASVSMKAPVATGGTIINTDGMTHGTPTGVTGAAGEQHYVQLAAGRIALYRKQDGRLHAGPFNLHTLFKGAQRDACAAPHAAPGSLLYDQHARRWLVSQLTGTPGRQVLCLAVSTSADPAGSYHRYVLPLRGAGREARFADDARMALWTNAVYLTFTLFEPAQGRYRGPRICAVDRAQLLRGRDAALRCADPGSAFGPVTAATTEGAMQAPGATPGLLLSVDLTDQNAGERLLLWRFAYPGAGLSAPLVVPVAPFRPACADAARAACIGQPWPGVALPAVADRPMARVVYRQQAGHATLLLAHAVQAGAGQTGLRWYELRDPLGAAYVYQQGTHAPDDQHRATGSIGMDKAGNIALGYGVAGAFTPPGVRYTGRQRSDPPGRMASEELVVSGHGVDDAGAVDSIPGGELSLDPVDDCTFWYTQQYLPLSGHRTWRTRIASFKFNRCM